MILLQCSCFLQVERIVQTEPELITKGSLVSNIAQAAKQLTVGCPFTCRQNFWGWSLFPSCLKCLHAKWTSTFLLLLYKRKYAQGLGSTS